MCFGLRVRSLKWLFGVLSLTALCACDKVLNAPRNIDDFSTNTLYSSFSGRSPKTLDPQVSYSSDETLYTYEIYEPLYQYHYLKRPYTITPRTAKNVASPVYLDAEDNVLEENSKTPVAKSRYRIELKEGIYFAPHPAFAKDEEGNYRYHALSDEVAKKLKNPLDLPYKGTRELTAQDYVYGIKRMASPRVVCPVLSLLSQYIPGLNDLNQSLISQDRDKTKWLDLRAYKLPGVRAIDRYTLEIEIVGKYPQFANWLTMAFFAPVPWEAEVFYNNRILSGNNVSLSTWPVGTGPFMLTRSKQNREHVLERNPNFRVELFPCEGERGDEEKGLLADCAKPIPFVDRIVMTLEKEAIPTTSKFLQGFYDSPQITRLDVGQGYLVAASDSADKAALYKSKQLNFPTTVEANLWYLGFNWLDPIVGEGKTEEEKRRNRLLRQAVSIAIDWEEQIAIFEKGQGQAAHGPLPPGLFGFDQNGHSGFNPVVYKKDGEGRVIRRGIEEARMLMREAGYPDGRDAKTGKPLVLNFDWQGTSAGSKSFLDWMARQFAKLGIQLEIRATDYNRFQDKMLKGSAQIYYWGWLADYPDAENFLFLLYGANRKAGNASGGENASNYANAEYDRLFERLKELGEGEEKLETIDRMIEIVQNDAVWSFGYFPTSAAALHHWVKNAKPTQIIRNNIQYLRIDAKERAQKIREWNRPILWPLLVIVLLIAASVFLVFVHVKKENNRTGRKA